MIIKSMGQSGYIIETECSCIMIDPHLFADHIDGGFIMEFNKPYHLTVSGLKPSI